MLIGHVSQASDRMEFTYWIPQL